jgi:hypothetical protein
MLKIVFFQESVLRNTLLSVNVDQCECVFGISWFSAFYRPSSVLKLKFCRFDELLKAWEPQQINLPAY